MARRRRSLIAAALATLGIVNLELATVGLATPAAAQDGTVNTLAQLFKRLGSCWRPPPARDLNDPGMQITVVVSFRRDGSLLGRPSIAYETREVSDEDRIRYETALAQTLQRCTPMPFTDELGGAVAGRPLRVLFDARRTKSTERTPWQTTTTL
jgi:hypothetical protein